MLSLPTRNTCSRAASGGTALVRRRMARMRAVSSRGVHGLVT
jgi:hypothetical protein